MQEMSWESEVDREGQGRGCELGMIGFVVDGFTGNLHSVQLSCANQSGIGSITDRSHGGSPEL